MYTLRIRFSTLFDWLFKYRHLHINKHSYRPGCITEHNGSIWETVHIYRNKCWRKITSSVSVYLSYQPYNISRSFHVLSNRPEMLGYNQKPRIDLRSSFRSLTKSYQTLDRSLCNEQNKEWGMETKNTIAKNRMREKQIRNQIMEKNSEEFSIIFWIKSMSLSKKWFKYYVKGKQIYFNTNYKLLNFIVD